MKVTKETTVQAKAGRKKTFEAPAASLKGTLAIHFCSGINLWDGTGGTIQCK